MKARDMLVSSILVGLSMFVAVSVNAGGSTERIGVLYAVHGGADTWGPQANFDSAIQIFSYDPNSFVYNNLIWNPAFWPFLSFDEGGIRQSRKFDFEYERIGGTDPFDEITDQQLEDMTDTLEGLVAAHNNATGDEIEVFTDLMSWISHDPADMPDPKSIYNPQVAGGAPMNYCGSFIDGGVPPFGTWPGCDPERYNVDGAVERMLANDVDRIIIVDTTTTGVRFFKTFDQLTTTRRVVDAYNAANGATVTVEWVNDPSDLMTESYPIAPAGWTATLGAPTLDSAVPLDNRTNPFVMDEGLAELYVTGTASQLRTDIPYSKQAVILLNHHVRAHNQYFDPKIDDTLVLNKNIRKLLRQEFNGLKGKNILGAWMGRREINPNIVPAPPTFSQKERTRNMRAESLGEAYLYETPEILPDGKDGYLYWDALEKLKEEGIEHIVIVFPQIFADSVLDMVEVPNQIAVQIGYKTWRYWGEGNFDDYPVVGHPFSDMWQFPDTQCRLPGSNDDSILEDCCFDLGGCPTGQPYPPERQSPITEAISDLDPHLGFDVPAYGHLGYDSAVGAPDDDAPVQDQYTGTWAMWDPPNDDPAAGAYIALKVWQHIDN